MTTPRDFNEIPDHIRKHNNHYLRINTTQESTGNDYTPIKTIVTIRTYQTQGEWETQVAPATEQTFEKEEPLYEALHGGINHDIITLASLTQYYPSRGGKSEPLMGWTIFWILRVCIRVSYRHDNYLL
jgi:hypothetical protein